jgi:hypothetical protein
MLTVCGALLEIDGYIPLRKWRVLCEGVRVRISTTNTIVNGRLGISRFLRERRERLEEVESWMV